MWHFCTYFDQHYLPQGLAMMRSLTEHLPDSQVFVLCMDDACHAALTELNLPFVRLIRLEDFESGDTELLQAKNNRSLIEYYFTCTPSLVLYVLKQNLEVDLVTYLDADLFFFSDPTPLFDELGDNSISLISHRYPPHLEEQYRDRGIYNVAWLSFRRDEKGMAALTWWRERCIEWCYDRVEEGRYADQKYLDEFDTRFTAIKALQHCGANVAVWNIGSYTVRLDRGTVLINDAHLIFYHFHGLRPITSWLYAPHLAFYGVKATRTMRKHIYGPYLRALWDTRRAIREVQCREIVAKSIRRQEDEAATREPLSRRLFLAVQAIWRAIRNTCTGTYFVCVRGCTL